MTEEEQALPRKLGRREIVFDTKFTGKNCDHRSVKKEVNWSKNRGSIRNLVVWMRHDYYEVGEALSNMRDLDECVSWDQHVNKSHKDLK